MGPHAEREEYFEEYFDRFVSNWLELKIMNTELHQVDVSISRRGCIRRRDFLKSVSAGAIAAGTISWPDWMSVQASELRKRGMSCILLWMSGGPSQTDTFDPKS